MLRSLRETTFAIVDVETTGVDPRRDRVVELACVVWRDGVHRRSFATLVDPGIPVPPRAAGIHHLTGAELAGEPSLEAVLPLVEALCADAVVVAHNAAFDLGFLPTLGERPSLCTLRLARRVFPELPSYANQTLRYALGAALPPAIPLTPHRAAGDAFVTLGVLEACLRRYRDEGGADDLDTLLAFASERVRHVAFGAPRRRARQAG